MKKVLALMVCLIAVSGCKNNAEDTSYTVNTVTESTQQVGDVVASIDESGGSTSGGFTMNNEIESARRAYARMTGGDTDKTVASMIVPEAQAAACNTIGFDTCGTTGAGKKVRDFASCTTGGGGTIAGNVTLTFNGTGSGTCTMPAVGDYAARVPNFTVTGLRGATFTVEATGDGQRVTRDSTGGSPAFTFTNSGIRRKFVTPKAVTLLDITSATTATGSVTVTGASRAGRIMNSVSGGGIVITNNLTSEACTLTPNSVTWAAGCNCPTSGSFSGTCTGTSDTFTVTFGVTCGSVTVTKTGDATNEPVTLDRCSL